MKMAVVVGNPKPKSTTYEASLLAAQKLTGAAPDVILDVAELGAGLLEWGNKDVEAAVASVCACDAAIIASPTYKATYTGLLKLFLDQIPPDGLAGVVALPLMLGAGPAHALAPDLTLKPVLVELGATCPARGLYLIDKTYTEDADLDAWVARTKPMLDALT
ncbi:MAG: NAD(P)H-dependent oxidoreductase [Rhodospirillales bacterium]|nr:NAD(P)H-dependent oxidoreductase [Rhodospirillales bacterium]